MALNGTRIREFDLIDLLEGIDFGTVALPNFQRDFEWSDGEVRALLATVLSGWPMGSLLLIEADSSSLEFYQPRRFDSAPPLAADLEYIVLDGQQRLTALYQAFFGAGPSRYAINVEQDFERDGIDAVDSAVRSFKASIWETKYGLNRTVQVRDRLVPVSALKTPTHFFEWRDSVSVGKADGLFTDMYRDHFSGLHRYRVPTVEVGTNLPPAAVARIFERVNKSGRRLSTFDLMVAKSFTPTFNLRDKWNDVKQHAPDVYRFCRGDGMPILSLISLRVRGDIRQSAVLDLPGSAIRDGFSDAVEHFAWAVQFAQEHLGVASPDMQPYGNQLVVMAGTDFDTALTTRVDDVRRWFFATAFSGRYAVASNTAAIADYKAFQADETPNYRRPVLVREVLEESTRQHNGALHRAILCVLAANLADETGADLHEQGLRPEQVFRRNADDERDPPTHLRSVTYALWQDDTPDLDELTEPFACEEQFLPPWSEPYDFADVAERRVAGIQTYLSKVFGAEILVVSEDEVSDLEQLTQAGTES